MPLLWRGCHNEGAILHNTRSGDLKVAATPDAGRAPRRLRPASSQDVAGKENDVDTLTHEQIEELQEHRPISHGGWKLAGGIVVHLWLILCAWALSRYVAMELAHITRENWAYLIGGGIFTIALMLMNLTLLFRQSAWLERFWHRNVRRYIARFYRTRNGGERQLGYTMRTTRESRRVSQRPNENPLAIDLPLNGSRGRILCNDDFWRKGLEGWSVRLRAILDTGTVMVEMQYRNRQWGIDERVVTTVGRALRFLEIVASGGTMSSLSSGWSDIVAYLDTDLHSTRQERDEVRHELAKAVFERDPLRAEYGEAVQFVANIIRDIEASDRLSRSLDGLRIVAHLLDWICVCYGEGSERSVERCAAYQTKLALVNAKLTEKEQRDRRRHGRRAGASAT